MCNLFEELYLITDELPNTWRDLYPLKGFQSSRA